MAAIIHSAQWPVSGVTSQQTRKSTFSGNERLFQSSSITENSRQTHVHAAERISQLGVPTTSVRSSWIDSRLQKPRRIASWSSRDMASSVRAPTQGTSSTTQSSNEALHSWVLAGDARPPLSHEEEVSYAADVQDLVYVESKKCQLLKELGRVPSDDEWADSLGITLVRLYARVAKGRSAKRKMVTANLPLVSSIAEQYQDRGLSHQELCQAGLVGLLKSTERYDSSRNTKFSSYAYFWIRERVAAAVKNIKHVLRIGHGVYATASVFLRRRDEFRDFHQRQPTLSELSEACKVDADRIREVFRIIKPAKSIDVDRLGGGISAEDVSHPLSSDIPWFVFKQTGLKEEIAKALEGLPPREKQVVQMRYGFVGESKTLKEVGEALGLHLETIRQIEKKALERLKGSFRSYLLQYLSGNLWDL